MLSTCAAAREVMYDGLLEMDGVDRSGLTLANLVSPNVYLFLSDEAWATSSQYQTPLAYGCRIQDFRITQKLSETARMPKTVNFIAGKAKNHSAGATVSLLCGCG